MPKHFNSFFKLNDENINWSRFNHMIIYFQTSTYSHGIQMTPIRLYCCTMDIAMVKMPNMVRVLIGNVMDTKDTNVWPEQLHVSSVVTIWLKLEEHTHTHPPNETI